MTKYSLIAIFAVIISCQTWTVSAWLETPHWYNELFGDGDFHDESSQLVEKHLSRYYTLYSYNLVKLPRAIYE